MEQHYVIIVVVIIAIVCLQIYVFVDNVRKLEIFKCVFPDEDNDYEVRKDNTNTFVDGISCPHKNKIFSVVIKSINKYLENNKGAVSDYHLMKDVVDRNCDAAEEEINTQIPVPLYLGLMGTMIGILVGVGYLVYSGGLNSLLEFGSTNSQLNVQETKSASEGVKALLGGVALAMISSIMGIFLTTIGSSLVKSSKVQVERNKNTFLSWIQANLLPQLSSDAAGAMAMMTQNLNQFNNTFSENTENLKHTLEGVSTASESQAQLLEELNKMKIASIAKANIAVYDKLQNCTDEIEKLGEYLKNTGEYLENVKELNSKLGEAEERTQRIDKMAEFFETEIKEIEQRKAELSKAVGKVDSSLVESFAELSKAVGKVDSSLAESFETLQGRADSGLQKFQDTIAKQQSSFEDSLEQQQKLLKEKLDETKKIIEKQQSSFEESLEKEEEILKNKLNETTLILNEIKNLTAVKESIASLKDATSAQNEKLDSLKSSILNLAETKTQGLPPERSTSNWTKAGVVVVGVLLFALLVMQVLNYFIPLKAQPVEQVVEPVEPLVEPVVNEETNDMPELQQNEE